MIQQTYTQAFDLSDELVLITGGGTGLGFGMAQCLKQAGAKIVLTGRRESILQEAAQKLGDSTGYRVHDVTEPGHVCRLTVAFPSVFNILFQSFWHPICNFAFCSKMIIVRGTKRRKKVLTKQRTS